MVDSKAARSTKGNRKHLDSKPKACKHAFVRGGSPNLPHDEETLRELAESFPLPSWLTRGDGTTYYHNRLFLNYLGKTQEKTNGWGWVSTLHPDDRKASASAWTKAYTQGKGYCIVYRIRRHDGQYRWHLGYAVPLRDSKGTPTRWFGICADIHERKMAEEALRAARAQLEKKVRGQTAELRGMVRSLRSEVRSRREAEKMILAQRDLAMRLASASSLEKALELCIHAALKISGMDCGGVYLLEGDRTHLVTSRGLSARFISAVSDGPPRNKRWKLAMAGKAVFTSTDLIQLRNKDDLRAEGLQALAVLPIIHSGRVIACFNLGSHVLQTVPLAARATLEALAIQIGHVIARLRAEQIVRQVQERQKGILEGIPDLVCLKDAQGRILELNQACCRHTKVSRKQAVGKNHADLNKGESFQQVYRDDLQVIQTGQRHSFEYTFQGRWFEVVKTPIFDGGRKVTGIVNIGRDITTRIEAQQRLEVANRQLQQRTEQLRALAAQLSHVEERERRRVGAVLHDELQQLLVGVKLNLGLLLHKSPSSYFSQELQRTEMMLDQAIQATRSLAKELSPPILFHGMVPALQWLAKLMQEKYRLSVLVQADKADNVSEDVRVLLFQAAREMLFNVVKHAQTNWASVSFAIRNGQARLRVADRGKGFDPAILDSTLTGSGGLGLLSIRERLGYLGGKLTIRSSPGRGSILLLQTPIDVGAAEAKE